MQRDFHALSRFAVCAFSVWIAARVATGQAPEGLPRVALPLCRQSPIIDGVIDETEWRCAARSVGFIDHRSGVASLRPGMF